MKKTALILTATIVSILAVPAVMSHCEIPCGIYGDETRFDLMYEHIQTIEKSMQQIKEISKSEDKNHNQLTRWIINKEEHANELTEIVTQYFMTQRLAPKIESNGKEYEDYIEQLTLLHRMMFYSMKCKQTTDLENTRLLRQSLTKFKMAYFANSSEK